MIKQIPRIVIAGTNSGCGKTTAVCAILKALINRGLRTAAFKCGPDYIDPMFHSRIIGARSSNLDSFFFSESMVRTLLAENAEACDVSILEGVMGFYDGLSLNSTKASTYEMSEITESPVILAVNARGASLSVLAVIEGFLHFRPNRIRGVILNQCTEMSYRSLKDAILQHFEGQIKPLGFLPVMPECTLESRHLGLVTAAEVENLSEKTRLLAEQAERSLDLDGILQIAKSADPVEYEPLQIPAGDIPVRIAVARDRAFCFYYEDSLNVLRRMGAQLVPFSPLSDRQLPENIQGLYLGGGYPELYAAQLSRNQSMRQSLRLALQQDIPCIAECGGFMYLTEQIEDFPMTGFLPGKSFDTGKLCRFGYVTLKAEEDNLLCSKGHEIRGHEFHHWDSEDPGKGFLAVKASGKSWSCVHTSKSLYAGYPHFHFCANLDFAEHFYQACVSYSQRNHGE